MNTEQAALLACLLEATVPKPGNVHRGADFPDMSFLDFVVSAVAVAPVLATATETGVGPTVAQAVEARCRVTAANTNLGILLLLAPLCCVPEADSVEELREGLRRVLASLTRRDSEEVYRAIRLAQPGGLGSVNEMDVAQSAPDDLLAAMSAAADRDRIAHQYVTEFADVFEFMLPRLIETHRSFDFATSVIALHVETMAAFPDSLIARKGGAELAAEASRRAAAVHRAARPGDDDYQAGLADLDFWLRSDGNRRNPGTTADLIAATLFVGFRVGALSPATIAVPSNVS